MTHLYYSQHGEEDVKELCNLLERIGINCEISEGLEGCGNKCLDISWDDYEVEKKLSRKAGAKRKHIGRKMSVADIRERMETEPAEKIARSLGISRSTLFRKIREAEKWGNETIY